MLLGMDSRTDATADKAEHEGGISRDLRRDLELCRDGVSRSRRLSSAVVTNRAKQ